MIHVKDINGITGYIRGGCTAIGMKKQFVTTFHETAARYEHIFFSAGKVGYQVEVHLEDISKLIRYSLADLVVEREG